MKEYVVLYKREFFEKNNSMWILRPIDIVLVKKKRGIFIWNKKEIPSIHDLRIIDNDNDLFIGEMNSKNSFRMFKMNPIKLKRIKESLIIEMYGYLLIGEYDLQSRHIEYRSIKLNYNEDELEYGFDYIDKTEEEIIDNLNYYKKLKMEYGEDVTIISGDDLELLEQMDNVEDLTRALKYLMNSKENYQFKLQDAVSINIMYDKYLKNVLKIKNPNELKSELNKLIEEINSEILKQLCDIEEDFSEISLSMNETLFSSFNEIDNVEDLKQMISIYQGTFKLTNKQVRALMKKAPKTLEFYEFSYDCLGQILAENDLKTIKTFLKNFNKKQIELLTSSEIYQLSERKKELAYQFNYNEVREQLISRIIGRDIQIDRILTTIERNDKLKNSSKRQSMIIAGPTGTGKTQTFFELKNALKDKRPVVIVDTNQLTQEGYVGGSIETDILLPLIMEAHDINSKKGLEGWSYNGINSHDIELARHGIVFLDEIDKRAGKDGSVNTEGVINQLLKLMDPGTSYTVRIGNIQLSFDTSDLTIFASGAFQEYFDKRGHQSIGFTDDVSKKGEYARFKEVDPLELVNYGLDRQYIGRCDKVTFYDPHTKESLIELESNKKTSNLQVEIDNYESMGISFVWEEGYLEEVVERAYQMKTGGRATKNIINRSLGPLNTEVNNHKDQIKTIFVPKTSLDDPGTIKLITKDDKVILLKDLMEATKKKNKELKKLQKVTINQNALEEAKQIIEKEKPKILELK